MKLSFYINLVLPTPSIDLMGVTKLSWAEKVQEELKKIDFESYSYKVVLETSSGEIRLVLFPEDAPKHCKNIIALAKSGFYDNLTFHRVIDGFVVQGGCPAGNGSGGPGYTIDAEFNNRPHSQGTLSMARSQQINSAGSQFFLCLGRIPQLDNQYTVFGQAEDQKSMDVIQGMGKVETASNDKPVEEIIIKKATILTEARL